MAVTPFKSPRFSESRKKCLNFHEIRGQGRGSRLFKQFSSGTAGYFKSRCGHYVWKTACNKIISQIFTFLIINLNQGRVQCFKVRCRETDKKDLAGLWDIWMRKLVHFWVLIGLGSIC